VSLQATQSNRHATGVYSVFFSGFKIDYEMIAGFIFGLFFIPNGKLYLTMDRTNWQWGKCDINILTLGIVFKGVAIPIFWVLLDKKGNSDTPERIALIQRFIGRFGKDCIAGILADREFIGTSWFGWMLSEKIPFYIRVKKNLWTTNSRGLAVKIDKLFYDLRPMSQRVLYGKRNVMGHELYLAALRMFDGELLIVATSESPGNAIEIYGLRWEIETLFGCLKGRGFNFEDTHVTDRERISRIFVLLSVAFCWAHKTGEWRHEVEPICLKTHGRPAVSLFRYGLDYLVEAIAKLVYRADLFEACIKQMWFFLSPPLKKGG
jgi:hypothetical protein